MLGERARRSGSRRPASRAAAARSRRCRRLRSSTAVSESKPRSRNGREASTARPVVVAEHRATWGGPDPAAPRARSASSSAGEPLRAARPPPRRPRPTARTRTSPRSTAGTSPRARSARRSSADGQQDRRRRAAGRRRTAPGPLGGQRGHAGAGQPCPVGVGRAAGHAAGRSHGPQASDDGGQTLGAAVPGERVEEGVGGGVVALARRAEAPAAEEKRTKRPGRALRCSSCRCQARVGLGPQDGVQRVGGQRRDDAVVEDAGGVHHAAQRCDRPASDRGQRVTVGDVARRDVDLRAQLASARRPVRRHPARPGRAATAAPAPARRARARGAGPRPRRDHLCRR